MKAIHMHALGSISEAEPIRNLRINFDVDVTLGGALFGTRHESIHGPSVFFRPTSISHLPSVHSC